MKTGAFFSQFFLLPFSVIPTRSIIDSLEKGMATRYRPPFPFLSSFFFFSFVAEVRQPGLFPSSFSQSWNYMLMI